MSAKQPGRCPRCHGLTIGKCEACWPSKAKDHDERRQSRHERGYTNRWVVARTVYLAQRPLCVCCKAKGQVEPATVVDHIQPHRGNRDLFNDQSNWQSLCRQCHDGDKRRIERRTMDADVPREWARHLAYQNQTGGVPGL